MTFVNEKITQEIMDKYNLDEFVIKQYGKDSVHKEAFLFSDLTVDHARGIWLFHIKRGRLDSDDLEHHWWGFFWKDKLLIFKFFQTYGGGDVDVFSIAETCWTNYELLSVELPRWVKAKKESVAEQKQNIPDIDLPEEIECQLTEIYTDLKEALRTYGASGTYHSCKSHEASFNF